MLNLGGAGDLTIFRPLAFIEIPVNLAVCTKSFSVNPRPVGAGATKEGGWRFGFSRFGGEGGSFSDVQYRARAIVWK